jgi:beta-1,4-N-acetylglucosaminyltransferase
MTRIGVISSCGGHLTEVRALRDAYAHHEHFYVVNDRILLPPDMATRTIFITHAERDWRVLLNFVEAWKILRRERPQLLLSTGAGPIVPFAVVGKLFGIPTIFVETITRVRAPSLTGRLMYWLTDEFYYQWEGLRDYFPKGKFGGPLI